MSARISARSVSGWRSPGALSAFANSSRGQPRADGRADELRFAVEMDRLDVVDGHGLGVAGLNLDFHLEAVMRTTLPMIAFPSPAT